MLQQALALHGAAFAMGNGMRWFGDLITGWGLDTTKAHNGAMPGYNVDITRVR